MMLLHGALVDHADWALYLASACTFACAIWAIRSSRLTRIASTADAIPLGLMGLGQLALPHLAGSIVEGLSFYPLLTALSALMFGFRYSFLLALAVQLMNVWAGLGIYVNWNVPVDHALDTGVLDFGTAGDLPALLTAQFVCLSAAEWLCWRQSGDDLGSTGLHRDTFGAK